MKSNTTILVLLVLAALVLSGCVGTQGPTTNNSSGDTGGIPSVTTQTSGEIAQDLSGGTGSSSDDISNDDLDAMEQDLDDLDSEVDSSAESDI